MLKPKKLSVQGSNIEYLGSDKERGARLDAAKSSSEFSNLGKEPLQIWRIENFVAKPFPKDKHGLFYSGDSYLILKKSGKEPQVSYDVHFWLGKYTTQDEAGAAAYKATEIDTILADKAIQHREVQGSESELFLSYFPKGIRVQQGGFDSTRWKHPEERKAVIHLYHVRGVGKHITAKEVKPLTDSLNSGDVYILDDEKDNIIVWVGSSANPFERSKAGSIAESIESERRSGARAKTVEENSTGADIDLFYNLLGGKTNIKSASQAPAQAPNTQKRILKIHASGGNISFDDVASGSGLKKDLLKSEDVFIVDSGNHLYIWVGKNSSSVEKLAGFRFAHQYLEKNARDLATPITQVHEGTNSSHFDSVFS